MIIRSWLLTSVIFFSLWSSANAETPALQELQVYPATCELSGTRDRQNLIVQAIAADGSTAEVTATATFEFAQPLATIQNGQLAPLADGDTTLTVSYAGVRKTIPIQVRGSQNAEPIQFRNDVLPVLTKVGCNTGKCHGAASGKDGFRLSLFGYDPDGDYHRLTREMAGRRLNLADPAKSLLVRKALGQVPHTGGQKIQPNTENEKLLLAWLQTGAQRDPKDARKPVSLEVFPKEAVIAAPGPSQRVVVRAKYSDGTDRDVTRFTVFLSNNDAAASVDDQGLVQAKGPGESFILARFDEFTAGVPVIVRPGTNFQTPQRSSEMRIDQLVQDKLNKLHILPNDTCTDEVFLRRVYLDLTGRLPSPKQRELFLANTTPNKREQLIDELIETQDFRDIWVMKWAEILQIRTINGITPKGILGYDRWLRDQVRDGQTIDKILQKLLPASGGTFDNPAVSYFQPHTTPELLAENVAQVFLGTRIQCAQCHNHPFDRWTMNDYYGFAAFFSQIGYKQSADPRELTVFNAGKGEMLHPIDQRRVPPKFLGAEQPNIANSTDYRQVLAEWISTPGNQAFARNYANIVWSHLFGKGIVDPVDDVRISNPPSNEPLLDYLAKQSIRHEFDTKKLIREICNSNSYQRTTQKTISNQWDERNFSRQYVRRIRAEILLDCINQVTETTESYRGVPEGGRAIEIPDGRTANYFLSTFGRATRETACSCEVKVAPTLSQALHLLNGDTTNQKIENGEVVQKLLDQGQSGAEIARQLYLRCLNREPTETERIKIKARIDSSTNVKESLEDLFWALLNTNEFIFIR